jgi:hypothetical protein
MAGKLGDGSRFRRLARQEAGRGAHSPEGLAAWIGRKKYGKQRFNELARAGRERAAEDPARRKDRRSPL